MNAIASGEFATRTAQRMTDLLCTTVAGRLVAPVPPGLPAGAVYLPDEKVIFAATACRKGLFDEAMWAACALTGADIVVAHPGRYPVPGILDDVSFTVLVHMADRPRLFEEMSLFRAEAGDYWLLPSGAGPCIALEASGPRVSCCQPFVEAHERAAGVAAAAARIIRTARTAERF